MSKKGNWKDLNGSQTPDGFYLWSKNLYGLTDENQHLYLDDRTCNIADGFVNTNNDLLNDKSRLDECVDESYRASVIAVVKDGVIEGDRETTLPSVLKRTDGTCGHDIHMFRDGTPRELIMALSRSEGSYIVEELLQCHEYARAPRPQSSNTLRFLMYNDGEPALAGCVQKWGTQASGWVDNFSQGGLTTLVVNGMMLDTLEDFTPVDQRVGNGSQKGSQREPTFGYRYPSRFHHETMYPICGTIVPFWNETIDLLKYVMDCIKDDIVYAGWDVIITPTGPKIIEGNPEPGVQLIQMHMPLLGDERFKAFFKNNGIHIA